MRNFLSAAAIAAAAVLAAPAHATTVALNGDGTWNEIDVGSFDGSLGWIDNVDNSALDFTFTIAAGHTGTLTVVDAGFAGDTFAIANFGAALGQTSAVPVSTYDPNAVGQFDFDAALADPSFSRGVFHLGAGTYDIGGSLLQSLRLDDGTPLDATLGGLRLSVSAVPEASSLGSMALGLAVVAMLARRRRASQSN